MLKCFSFSSPVWLIPAVLVSIVCVIQAMHVVVHGRYCKAGDEWCQIYDQKSTFTQSPGSDEQKLKCLERVCSVTLLVSLKVWIILNIFCAMSSGSLPSENSSSAPADLQVRQLIRDALSELADSPLDGDDYNRVVDAFVRRDLIQILDGDSC